MSDNSDIEFFKTFTLVLLVLVLVAVAALWLAKSVTESSGIAANNPLFSEEAVAERIAPVGKLRQSGDPAVVIGAEPKSAAPAGPRDPKELVASVCAGCHQAGTLNAPKLDDKAAWETRFAVGLDALTASAIKGKGGMPPKGGCSDCSDADIRGAIQIMLADVGIDAGTPAAAKSTSAAAPAAAAPAAAAPVAAAPAPVETAAPAVKVDAEKIYKTACIGCHAAAVMGAPRPGDKAAWATRKNAAGGMDGLYHSAINGKAPGMPPRGTCMSCSDDDLKAVVDYMIAQ
ncbi:MAG: c-type cytochrome [Gammaproteobacteria bacterium]